jgi:hypothetical protein
VGTYHFHFIVSVIFGRNSPHLKAPDYETYFCLSLSPARLTAKLGSQDYKKLMQNAGNP